jgi:hypothetical protein
MYTAQHLYSQNHVYSTTFLQSKSCIQHNIYSQNHVYNTTFYKCCAVYMVLTVKMLCCIHGFDYKCCAVPIDCLILSCDTTLYFISEIIQLYQSKSCIQHNIYSQNHVYNTTFLVKTMYTAQHL